MTQSNRCAIVSAAGAENPLIIEATTAAEPGSNEEQEELRVVAVDYPSWWQGNQKIVACTDNRIPVVVPHLTQMVE